MYCSKLSDLLALNSCFLKKDNTRTYNFLTFMELPPILTLFSGADPERNLTRAQPKSRGCGYMGVAISMGWYKHDLADAAQLSA